MMKALIIAQPARDSISRKREDNKSCEKKSRKVLSEPWAGMDDDETKTITVETLTTVRNYFIL
jgi:hypothetical protein